MNLHRVAGPAVVALVLCSCSSTPVDGTPGRCQEIAQRLTACYPGAAQGTCDAQTVSEYDRLDLGSRDCTALENLGKSDASSVQCGRGAHVCSLIFCCRDYTLTWTPGDESDWADVPAVVRAFQADIPGDAWDEVFGASASSLQAGVARSYVQEVAQYTDGDTQEMTVELTRQLIDVPYRDFIAAMVPETWGVHLAGYLGGEVRIYDQDDRGRALRQVERMVLSAFPGHWDAPLINNDMTKVEVLEHDDGSTTVYWRVMFSDNLSTEADVGSVTFESYPEADATMVTFHSAHRINALGAIPLPYVFVGPALEAAFLRHTAHYRTLVTL